MFFVDLKLGLNVLTSSTEHDDCLVFVHCQDVQSRNVNGSNNRPLIMFAFNNIFKYAYVFNCATKVSSTINFSNKFNIKKFNVYRSIVHIIRIERCVNIN